MLWAASAPHKSGLTRGVWTHRAQRQQETFLVVYKQRETSHGAIRGCFKGLSNTQPAPSLFLCSLSGLFRFSFLLFSNCMPFPACTWGSPLPPERYNLNPKACLAQLLSSANVALALAVQNEGKQTVRESLNTTKQRCVRVVNSNGRCLCKQAGSSHAVGWEEEGLW